MVVSLFTARIVLQTLGVTDYGIHNVVGGVVGMFNFLSGSLSHATNRFFSFELGRDNYDKLQKIFALLFILFLVCAIVLSIISDIVGLWWVNHKLVIPSERLVAAQFVFHASVFCFVISMLQVPYWSLIIAHEDMSFFAWMSIADVAAKLLAVCSLVVSPFDKLKTYAALSCVINFILFLIYHNYCRKKYPESKFKWFWDKPLFMEIISYSSYNLTTQIGTVLKDQGVNILLNMFFGTVINAARAIAYQINSVVSSFMLNFQTAVNPQIIKSYSSGNYESMQNLIIRFTKINYYIMLLLGLPVILNIDFILNIWLGIVPEYTATFVIIVLITSVWICFAYSLLVAVRATGNIKNLQIGNTIIILSVFPVSYILCKHGFSPTVILCIPFFESMFLLIWGVICLKKLMAFPFRKYAYEVFSKVIVTTVIAIIIPLFLKFNLEKTTVNSIITIAVSFMWIAITIYIVGLSKLERQFVIKQIKRMKMLN
jgi:O-antigen/teichoic acid export membrane protein